MRSSSTVCSILAVTVFSFRRDGELLAVGALKRLDARHVELKSMHTAESARRRGIGRAMVEHLLGVARDRGFRQFSLETGSMQRRSLRRGYTTPAWASGRASRSVITGRVRTACA